MERQIGIRFENEELAATIHYPNRPNEGERQRRVPLVVICHGFVGNRIGVDRLFVKTARELAEGGILYCALILPVVEKALVNTASRGSNP